MKQSITPLDLNDERIMSSAEACKKWGIDPSTLRKQIKQFPKGTIRKLGRDWVVTEEGMIAVFGKNLERRNNKSNSINIKME